MFPYVYLVTFQITVFLTTTSGQSCLSALIYEKTTGVKPNTRTEQDSYVLYRGPQTNGVVLTSFCGLSCRQDATCVAYTVDYDEKVCFGYRSSLGSDYRLINEAGVNLFHKICLQSVDEADYVRACTSKPYWSFERVSGYSLDVVYNKTIPNVASREECIGMCVVAGIKDANEAVCRSATYSIRTQTCALSTETRFTQPTSFNTRLFTDYLENQCSQRSPASSCSYQAKSNVGVISVDLIANAPTVQECQKRCDALRDFVCRSLEFQPVDRLTNNCLLSGDNTATLGDVQLPDRPDSMYRERECVAESCINGIYTYEKMTSTIVSEAIIQSEITVPAQQTSKTEYCLQQCNINGVRCPAIYVSYNDRTCKVLGQNSQGRDDQLLLGNQAMSFFEKVCLRGSLSKQKCGGKNWAFERVVGYQLASTSYYESKDSVISRQDCEEMCLASDNCMSALYESDLLRCKLSKYTRRTRQSEFQMAPSNRGTKINYLENSCVSSPANCQYKTTQNTTTVFSDIEINGYPTERSCREYCNSVTSLVCRSYSYFQLFQRCYISGDDSISSRNQNKFPKLGALYAEKSCSTVIPPDENCQGGITSYEKVSATRLSSASTLRQITIPNSVQLKSDYCLRQCTSSGQNCPSVQLTYTDSLCSILDQNSAGRSGRLESTRGQSYFERICLKGLTAQTRCSGKSWAFDRVVGYQLISNLYYRTKTSISTRQDCEVICLESSACKSALYESDTQDCKLSTYTRRSRRSDFIPASALRKPYIDYLENNCVPAPDNCKYNRFSDSKTAYPSKVVTNVVNEDACKENCESTGEFTCRSYSYQQVQQMCYISADDTVSVSLTTKFSQFGSTYVERICTTTVIPTSTDRPTDSRCNADEVLLMEKTLDYMPRTAFEQPLHVSKYNSLGITNLCKIKCADKDGCDAFIVDHGQRPPRCSQLRSSSDNVYLVKRNYVSYFNHVCMKSTDVPSTCDSKLWAFQRFPFSKLPSAIYKETYTVSNRLECQTKCLTSTTMTCRSILYDTIDKSCRLSEQNRLLAGNFQLQNDPRSEYIENNCIDEGNSCRYRGEQYSRFFVYATKTIPRSTLQRCTTDCKNEKSFNCLSVTFLEENFGQGTCLLNSESLLTAGPMSIQLRQGSIYVDRVCQPTIPSTTVAPPVKCESNEYTFEKLTGYDVGEQHQEMNSIADPKNLAKGCADECIRLGAACDAFIINYKRKQCFSIRLALTGRAAIRWPSDNYFRKDLNISFLKKICMPENNCVGKTWLFDRVLNFHLVGSIKRELVNVVTRHDCQRACQSEQTFNCSSANYFHEGRICQLSSDSRRTRPASFRRRAKVDYLENQCIKDPPSCEYKSTKGKFLPFYDKLLTAGSEDQCRQLCDQDPNLPCRSYSFNNDNGECYLSGDDTWSRPEGQDAFRTDSVYANYVYGEKGGCELAEVVCNDQYMSVTLTFREPFNGIIYAKQKPKDCFVYGEGKTSNVLNLPLGAKCGTIAESKIKYVNEIVIQKHRVIQTSNDEHVRIVCTFDSSEQILMYGSHGLGRQGDFQVTTPRVMAVTSLVTNRIPPPQLRMMVTDQNGNEGHVVGIGDVLKLRIEFQNPKTTLGIFVKNLTAETVDGDVLTLIDPSGCPVDTNVFPALKYDPVDGKSQFAMFKAFRFPTSGYITFKARIHFCQDRCPPVSCPNNVQSFGRKRRDFPTSSLVDSEDLPEGSGILEFNETDVVFTTNSSQNVEIDSIESEELFIVDTIEKDLENSFKSTIATVEQTTTTTVEPPTTTTAAVEPPTTTTTIEPPTTTTTAAVESPTTPTTVEPPTTTTTVEPTTAIVSSTTKSTRRTTTVLPTYPQFVEETRDPLNYGGGVERNSPILEAFEVSKEPLVYSLLVSPSKDDYLTEDRAQGIANLGVQPKTNLKETYTLYEKDEICSDRATVIATVLTVVLVHIFALVGGFCYYRYRMKRRNKSLEYAYTATTAPPLPARNKGPSPEINDMFGRPNMTFRNIYGYITSPEAEKNT